MNEEEDSNTLNRLLVKANHQGVQEYGALMQAWDSWNKETSEI